MLKKILNEKIIEVEIYCYSMLIVNTVYNYSKVNNNLRDEMNILQIRSLDSTYRFAGSLAP